MKQLLLGTTSQSALMGSGSYTPAFPTALVNGGFETGDFTGWATTGNPLVVTQVDNGNSSNYPPHEGTYCAYGGTNVALSTISQSVSVPADKYTASQLGTLRWTLSYWGNNFSDDDPVSVEILFYDAASSFLGRYDQPAQSNYLYGTWNEIVLSGICPAGTAFATITFTFTRTSGSNNNGYVDLVSMVWDVVAPEVETSAAISYAVLGGRQDTASVFASRQHAILGSRNDAVSASAAKPMAVLAPPSTSLAVQSAKTYAIIIP